MQFICNAWFGGRCLTAWLEIAKQCNIKRLGVLVRAGIGAYVVCKALVNNASMTVNALLKLHHYTYTNTAIWHSYVEAHASISGWLTSVRGYTNFCAFHFCQV